MSLTAWIVCKAFLQKCDPKKRDALLSHLPILEKQQIESLPHPYGDPTQETESIAECLGKIHFSWFSSFLRTLPENEIRLFIGSLNETQRKGLKKMLRLSNDIPELSPLAKLFFQHRLYDAIKEDNEPPLPISCLPQGPLNALAEMDEGKMNLLIEYLGLHDLAIELRLIIQTSKLKLIYSSLSEKEQHYLKMIMHQKETVSFKRMGLDKWDGNIEHLRSMILQRGLNRLAKALYSQDPHLIWHLCHRLDTEQAAILKRFCTPLEPAKASHALVGQVMELASHLQNEQTP